MTLEERIVNAYRRIDVETDNILTMFGDYEFIAKSIQEIWCEVTALYDKAMKLAQDNKGLKEERDLYQDLVGLMDHPDANQALRDQNDEMREIISDLWPRAAFTMTEANNQSWLERFEPLGIEVNP